MQFYITSYHVESARLSLTNINARKPGLLQLVPQKFININKINSEVYKHE